MHERGSTKNQFLGAFCLLLTVLSNGALSGWTSPNIPVLISDHTPLESGKLTMEQISWIVSLISPGSVLGIVVFSWMMDHFGHKFTGCFLAIPQIVSWLLIYIATNEIYLYFSRFLMGFVGGGMFTLIPIYIIDISDTRVRGLLGSLLVLFVNFGYFIGLVTGAYLDFRTVPLVCLVPAVASIIGFSFFPDSPSFLSKNNRFIEAEQSLRFYRGLPAKGGSDLILDELTNLKTLSIEGAKNTKETLSLKDFAPKAVQKSILICMGLMTLNQLCGIFAMGQYTATIFEKAGSFMSPNASAIFVGIIQIVGSYCSTFFVEKAGRKILMTLSAFGISLGHFSLSTFIYLESIGTDLEAFKIVPFISYCVIVFTGNVGVLCLPFVIMAEMLPYKVKTAATSFCLLYLNVLAFIMIKFLPWMMDTLGLDGMVLAFSICSFIGTFFVILILPETKGKTLTEILNMLNK